MIFNFMSLFYFESDALHCSTALMHRPVYRVFIRCIFFSSEFQNCLHYRSKAVKVWGIAMDLVTYGSKWSFIRYVCIKRISTPDCLCLYECGWRQDYWRLLSDKYENRIHFIKEFNDANVCIHTAEETSKWDAW